MDGHIARMGQIKFWSNKPDGNEPLGRRRRGWKDDIEKKF